MNSIKLTVVTINLNNVSGLKATVGSVLSQTLKNFEYFVADGMSTDGGKEYLESLTDPRLNFVCEKDQGIYFAQNKGIKMTNGEYILFLNSGDVLAKDTTLEEILSSQLSSDLIYGDMFIESVTGFRKLGKQPSKISLTHLLLDTIWHPACLIKRDLFDKFGLYNTEFKIVADYEFWLRIFSSKSVSIKYIPVVFSKFNLEGLSSAPENRTRLIREREIAQSLYYDRSTLFLFRDIPSLVRSFFFVCRSFLKKFLITINLIRR
ncbi:glycosyltransferase [Leptospira yasudae]|uniref:glycosyltransferase family 2 protein n=1 Tax=Leptospira yasudae TaxID=2202201 RepID=UPI000E59B855|nr:glycosyltransferase family 2 protein [Leptospira yasudae]RHX91220.1 glycosyltransferase [Leptospira yasudae]